jgi:hypothetical protein
LSKHEARLALQRFGIKLALLTLVCAPVVTFLACGGSAPDPPQLNPLLASSVSATNNPLVARYTVNVSVAATVSIEFGPTTSYGLRTSSQATPLGGGAVNILVAGMKQNTAYHMRAVLTSSAGQTFDQDHTFQTGAIPAAMIPQMQWTTMPGQQPTSGVELVSGTGEEFALDTSGNIIWYYNYQDGGTGPYFVRQTPNGNMLMIINFSFTSSGIREIDLAGNTVRELDSTELSQKLQRAGYNIQMKGVDHDVLVLPNGHWLFISVDTRVFTDLPGYPGQLTVSGNAIIDVDQNNNPVWVWDAFDHMDVNRHPMNFPDWTHANALFYTPEDGNFLLSMRHQHWVLKVNYRNGSGSGDILWRLGHEGDFALLNSNTPADWFYAQHDANIITRNTTGDVQILLFDNGNNRVLDDGGDTCDPNGGSPMCYSTAAIFDVNQDNLTATRAWSYQLPFSFWGGSAQELPNSNILISATAPAGLDGSTVQEVTQQPTPVVVWTLQLHKIASYRVTHLGSLYPGIQW